MAFSSELILSCTHIFCGAAKRLKLSHTCSVTKKLISTNEYNSLYKSKNQARVDHYPSWNISGKLCISCIAISGLAFSRLSVIFGKCKNCTDRCIINGRWGGCNRKQHQTQPVYSNSAGQTLSDSKLYIIPGAADREGYTTHVNPLGLSTHLFEELHGT